MPMIQDLTITIPVARFSEMLVAENELIGLKEFIGHKRSKYCGISHQELETICNLYSIPEGEEND